MLFEFDTVQKLCDKFYEADSLTALFESVPAFAIIEYLKKTGIFNLIWRAQDYEALIMNVKTHKLEEFIFWHNQSYMNLQ